MKQPTNRQIETANRALACAISDVVKAWLSSNPYPSWELEQEWEQANPSPRRQHKRLEDAVRAPLQQKANALMLKLRMGEIPSELAHDELSRLLEEIRADEARYICLE